MMSGSFHFLHTGLATLPVDTRDLGSVVQVVDVNLMLGVEAHEELSRAPPPALRRGRKARGSSPPERNTFRRVINVVVTCLACVAIALSIYFVVRMVARTLNKPPAQAPAQAVVPPRMPPPRMPVVAEPAYANDPAAAKTQAFSNRAPDAAAAAASTFVGSTYIETPRSAMVLSSYLSPRTPEIGSTFTPSGAVS